jgi:DNA-binding GntR family transcriptional regulator
MLKAFLIRWKLGPSTRKTSSMPYPQPDHDLRSLTEHVAADLMECISAGKFRAGERIIEADVAAQFQVSHGSVRDAFRLLHKQGLVEVIPRHGARVIGKDKAAQSYIPMVLAAFVRTALARTFATQSKQSLAKLCDPLKVHIEYLSELSREPFASGNFVYQLDRICSLVITAAQCNILPRFWARQMAGYRVYCAALPATTAQAIASSWQALAEQDFETQKQTVFDAECLFTNCARAASLEPTPRRLTASQSPRVPDYPEVQSYLDAVDGYVQISSSLHPTLSTQIANKLRERIQTGEYGFGDRFTEVELSNRFLASRAPVRDALRILDEEGLVELRPRRGAIVRRMSPGELAELYDIREGIGDLCARGAARNNHADPRWEQLFDEGLDLMERAHKNSGNPPVVWLGLRRSVSKLVYFRANNLVAFTVAREIENRLATQYLTHGDQVRKSFVLGNWQRIRNAIVANDEERAGRALSEAINRSKNATLEALKLGR